MHVMLQIPATIDWAVVQKNENVLQEQATTISVYKCNITQEAA